MIYSFKYPLGAVLKVQEMELDLFQLLLTEQVYG